MTGVRQIVSKISNLFIGIGVVALCLGLFLRHSDSDAISTPILFFVAFAFFSGQHWPTYLLILLIWPPFLLGISSGLNYGVIAYFRGLLKEKPHRILVRFLGVITALWAFAAPWIVGHRNLQWVSNQSIWGIAVWSCIPLGLIAGIVTLIVPFRRCTLTALLACTFGCLITMVFIWILEGKMDKTPNFAVSFVGLVLVAVGLCLRLWDNTKTSASAS